MSDLSSSSSAEDAAATADADVALRVRLLQVDADSDTGTEDLMEFPVAKLYPPHSDTLVIRYPATHAPRTPASTAALAAFMASEVQSLFIEEKATIAYILSNRDGTGQSTSNGHGTGSGGSGGCHGEATAGDGAGQAAATTTSCGTSNGPASSSAEQWQLIKNSLSPELADFITRRAGKSFKYSEQYHLSFTLVTPDAAPSSWDIEPALYDYMQPLLDVISPISNFSVDTQVQNYAKFSDFASRPVFDAQLAAWTLKTEDLSGFINAAEWPLNPSTGGNGDGPTINFIVYVPAAAQSPLVIKESQATRWLIPRWGGVVILNPPASGEDGALYPKHITQQALRPAMATFSRQLLTLLGAPSSSSSTNSINSSSSLPLRLRTLIRIHTATLLLSASGTLGSLARLPRSIPSIPIPANVSSYITLALAQLTATCALLREGRFTAALAHARVAEAAAEKAFFEKSMLPQAYFPEEHKVAVYLPFLGPVCVPLVVGLVKEVVRLVKERKGVKEGGGGGDGDGDSNDDDEKRRDLLRREKQEKSA